MKRGKLRRLLRFGLINMRRVKKTLAFSLHAGNPVEYNNMLSDRELAQRKTVLKSYPRYVGFNLSALCNQQCLFCPHDNKNVENKNWLEPSLFKRMKWLKHIETIDLFSGGGESLLNPCFPEILRTVRKLAPFSKLTMFTNGLALEGENLEAVFQCLDSLHISLNAVHKEVFESVIIGNYEKTMQNLEELAKRKPSKLYVEVSMVLVRNNVSDAKAMIDLASKLGFNRVVFCHFYSFWHDGRLDYEQCLINEKNLVAEVRQLDEYAKARGVDFFFPDPAKVEGDCTLPWITAYLKTDIKGFPSFQMCCFSHTNLNLAVSREAYVHFKKVWNHPRMQLIRQTVNEEANKQNPMCYLCRTVDTMNAEWVSQLDKLCHERFGFMPDHNSDNWGHDLFAKVEVP